VLGIDWRDYEILQKSSEEVFGVPRPKVLGNVLAITIDIKGDIIRSIRRKLRKNNVIVCMCTLIKCILVHTLFLRNFVLLLSDLIKPFLLILLESIRLYACVFIFCGLVLVFSWILGSGVST